MCAEFCEGGVDPEDRTFVYLFGGGIYGLFSIQFNKIFNARPTGKRGRGRLRSSFDNFRNPVFSLDLLNKTIDGCRTAEALVHRAGEPFPRVREHRVDGDDLSVSVELTFELLGRGLKLTEQIGGLSARGRPIEPGAHEPEVVLQTLAFLPKVPVANRRVQRVAQLENAREPSFDLSTELLDLGDDLDRV